MNRYLILPALFLAGIFAVSCSSDEPIINSFENNECLIKFSLNINAEQANEPFTRSLASGYHFSDGKSISVVKCYVYNQASGLNSEPVKVIDVQVNNLKGDVTIPLPKTDLYDIVFLATSIPQTDNSSKLYYSTTERSLNINYNLINTNDEELDCFYCVSKGVSSNSSTTISVELKRPFAQLNIGAKNLTSYDASFPIKSTSVTVNGIYSKMTLMDGNVSGTPTNVTFGNSQIPSNQNFPVSGAQYLSMNYLLVNQRKLVDSSILIEHYDSSLDPINITIQNIAVERNYQTNLIVKELINQEFIIR